MPQNWWEMYPEIQPSPAARPRPLPGPGGLVPGPAMAPLAGLPYAAVHPLQAPPSVFDPSYFSGAAFTSNQLLDRAPVQPPLPGDYGALALDRKAAVRQAAAAIRGRADPRAVRARLNQIGAGGANLASLDPFVDLVRDGPQLALDGDVSGQRGASALPGQMPTASVTRKPTVGAKSLSIAAVSQPDDPPEDPFTHMMTADERGVVQPDHTRSAASRRDPNSDANLTPWQRRRREENEALAANPRIRALLDAIALAEGDTDYDSLYGNHHQTFADRSTHPGNVGQNGGGAAGRYQILPATYRDLNNRLGPYSMSDRDQDLMAIELIRERNALPLILSGNPADFDEAVSRLGQHRTWASFPVLDRGVWRANPSGQRTEDIRNIRARFNQSLNRASRRAPGISAAGSGIISP